MDQDSAAILKAAGIHLRQFSPPKNGLICLENLNLESENA
ncbi:hypothetical protein EYZ11_005017 [Aspergillus tanneri]|uniref:Uncharacterized protein n=1 Tax=Aspergillus tanneri TaxID=1220188 RepID=A0A4S3JJE8_9EURO|nr:hypothetical protein EYZ11_005017 [Aspergillus tanneri]